MPNASLACTALACVLATISCGSTKTGAAPSGTIAGTITYAGAAAGGGRPLSIAVYAHCPPSGPPVAYQLVETYRLPYRYQFVGLSPRTYCVGALIDVDPLDTRYVGMLNPKRDPHGYSASERPVVVDELAGASGIDITLEDVP
jgi:hypothetical protein